MKIHVTMPKNQKNKFVKNDNKKIQKKNIKSLKIKTKLKTIVSMKINQINEKIKKNKQ
jgi:hypothetical protein